MGSFFEWKEVESIGHSVKMQHFSTFFYEFSAKFDEKTSIFHDRFIFRMERS